MKSPRVTCPTRERLPAQEQRPFPIVDCAYQTFPLDRFGGGSARDDEPSFFNISREYFRYEARRSFLVEAAFFLALAVILALTFISGALVIIHFLQLPEA
ncbi:MAG TPA: hypothetical protein VFA58_04070 [Chthoniobacterales bacterium]|nr:hypothetical protein [Chthoniobacterales bacterium]